MYLLYFARPVEYSVVEYGTCGVGCGGGDKVGNKLSITAVFILCR